MITKQGLIELYANERDKHKEYCLKIRERLKTGKLDEQEAYSLSQDYEEHKLIAAVTGGVVNNLKLMEDGE